MPIRKFTVTKSYKHAYVQTWGRRELPKELLSEILEVLGASGDIGTDIQNEASLKKSDLKRIELTEGGALFSPSFSEQHFNEPFNFFVNENELIVENPFVLGGRGKCFSKCSYATIEWGPHGLDVRIKYVTLGIDSLEPATKSSEELWSLLADIDPDEYDDALNKSKLLGISSFWSDLPNRVWNSDPLVDIFITELASALSNRLSDCLNLHFCDTIESRLEKDEDCSLIGGEEHLLIELDK